MDARPGTCLYCGGPLEPSHRVVLYCCEKHRRKAQDARRKRERAEARKRKREGFTLMRDPFARRDHDAYTEEQLFANAPLDAAPIIGPGDKEETLAKRAARRSQEARKTKRRKTKARIQKPRKTKPGQLSLLDLKPEPKKESLVKVRGWKKNWLTLC